LKLNQDVLMSAPLMLETFLPYRLAVTAGAVSRGLSAVYEQRFGLTIAEWRILANLGRFGALTAGAVAEHSTLEKPKVTRALQRLKTRRLVSCKTGRTDRREIRIALTAAGLQMYRDISGLALSWEANLLAVLSADERVALLRMLKQLDVRAMDMLGGGGVQTAA
jgi:DNA-binding MarR family transcriptional regulator